MCVELSTVAIFVNLATWTVIAYHAMRPNMFVTYMLLFACNAAIMCTLLYNNCAGFIQPGLATQVVLLVALYVSGTTPPGDTRPAQAARRNSEKTAGLERGTGSQENQRARKGRAKGIRWKYYEEKII